MHLCIYIATHIHTVCLNCGYRRCLKAIQGAPDNSDRVNSEIDSAAVIEQVWACSWRPWSINWGDSFGGGNRASLEIHLEAAIERDWRPLSTEFGDALAGHNGASLKICTWSPWAWDLEGRNRASLDKNLKAVDGQGSGCWHTFHQLTHNCGTVTTRRYLRAVMESWFDSGRLYREAHQYFKLHSGVNS
jgi:hypothetical protein